MMIAIKFVVLATAEESVRHATSALSTIIASANELLPNFYSIIIKCYFFAAIQVLEEKKIFFTEH